MFRTLALLKKLTTLEKRTRGNQKMVEALQTVTRVKFLSFFSFSLVRQMKNFDSYSWGLMQIGLC